MTFGDSMFKTRNYYPIYYRNFSIFKGLRPKNH
jgi:hypothetical protein